MRLAIQETLIQRWGIARPSIKTRTDLINEKKEVAKANAEMVTISEICDFIEEAVERNEVLTKTEVAKGVKGNYDENRKIIDKLLNQKRLASIPLPALVTGRRIEQNFLAVLNLKDQEEYKASGEVPEHKTAQYYAICQQPEV